MHQNFTRFAMFMAIAMFAGIGSLMAQGSVSGRVIDSGSGEPLEGATVVVDGTSKGALTRFDGSFMIYVDAGSYTLKTRYVGYTEMSKDISVSEGNTTEAGDIAIVNASIGMEGVEILASLVQDRKTPVASSTIDAKTIELELSNKEFPELLRSTPSVYVTRSGGGFGDSRINVRGFDQRNTAVLINGIPVNDMENGWVYWSNWAGLSDVTRTIQIQRGLGASKLAINSVGGTINLITKTTDMEAGGNVNFQVGNDGFMKFGATASTGRLENGLAVTLSGSRTTGRGYVDATYIDAYSYFASISKDFGAKHQLVLTAVGAPQRHGQRSFRENVTQYVAYSDTTQSYTDMIGSSTASDFDERQDGGDFMYSAEGNIRYNSDWGVDRDGDIFSIRENFYHKPQIALNHYWTVNDKVNIKSSAYYSIGRGGGTGDRGSIGGRGTWGYRNNDGIIRVADIQNWNSGMDSIDGFPAQGHHQDSVNGYVATERNGLIRRASMNEHNWLGLLSSANIALKENMDLTAGVDIRHYTGLHYRRLDDLMGNDYYLDPRDINQMDVMIDADGDSLIDSKETGHLINEQGRTQAYKLNYDNDGVVGWQGAFAQFEMSPTEDFNFFVAASGSNTSYTRIDRFNYIVGTETDGDSIGATSATYNFLGYNTKAGANYNIDAHHNVFINGGLYNRAPNFDGLFTNFTNDANPEVKNENIMAIELGYGARYKYFDVNFNLYRTGWQDRTLVRGFIATSGVPFTANITGLNALHQGVELEVAARPVNGLTLRGMLSVGDWQWTEDVEAIIIDDNNQPIDTLNIYAADLKVGDAAQTTASLSANYRFGFGLGIRAQYNYAADLYASFDPTTRTDIADRGKQAYKLPSYGMVDLGLNYDIDFDKVGFTLLANMNNVLDNLYVQEAFDDPTADSLDDLRGFFGFGRSWSAGISVRFK